MIVAIDLDEVVLNFVDPYLEFINTKYGTNHKRSDLKEFSLEENGFIPPGSSRGNLLEFGNLGGFRNLEFMPGAESGLFDLSNMHSIFFLTSREPESKYDTEAHLEELGWGMIPIYFSHGTTKGQIIQNTGARVLIDDSPTFINETRGRLGSICTTICMTQTSGVIEKVHGVNVVADWEELRVKHPDLFAKRRI